MPIQFSCPHCGKQTIVDDQFAGRSGPCAACGQTITVPGFGAAPVASGSVSKTVLIVALVCAIPMFLMCVGVLAAILLPAVQKARQAAQRVQCSNNLKQLALAMHGYANNEECFPPAFTVDEDGKPLHSWRTLLLPYLDEQGLLDQIDLKEPWDSPKNQAFASSMPKVFRCPADQIDLGKATTNYVVITGKDALFETNKFGTGRKLGDVPDGLSNTILIVEVVGLDIPWMKPQDIDITAFVRGEILKGKGHPHHVGGFNVAYADGSVRFMRLTITPEARKALATRAGGEVINHEDL